MTPVNRPAHTFSSRNLHGRIAHDLGARIISGNLAPGHTLPNESDYSAMLEVSRTALREAIKILAAKGLVESKPRIGTRVRARDQWNMLDPDVLAWTFASAPDEKFAADLFEVRMMIEPPAAALAARRAPEPMVAKITTAYEGMVAALGDLKASVGPDLQFHMGILKASGNELLVPLASLIETALVTSFTISSSDPEARRRSLPRHKKVLDAIVAGDAAGAQGAMENLLGETMADIRVLLARDSTTSFAW